jgi:hypothetical protein
MKCDDFIVKHEAGSALAKWRATVHARHCAKCAAVRERLIELRRTLSVPAEITPYHRRVWERAAADAAAGPAPAWSWLTGPRLAMAGGFAVAAAIIVAIVLSVASNNPRNGERIVENTNPPSVEILPLRVLPEEVALVEHGLNQVEADLKRLAEEAALLDARVAINELAALYPPLGAEDSS